MTFDSRAAARLGAQVAIGINVSSEWEPSLF